MITCKRSFQKAHSSNPVTKNATGIPENAEKGLQATLAVGRSHDALSKSALSCSRCTGSTYILQFKFDWERSSGATGQATVLLFSAFRGHGL